jgi:hypothetical protein
MGQILECLDPKSQRESGTKLNRPGESGAVKDQESLEPKKTRRVWKEKDQESLEREESKPGEFGTGREETRRV